MTKYNYNEISKENNLRGYFVKEMLDKLNNCEDKEKNKIENAIEIGLNSLE